MTTIEELIEQGKVTVHEGNLMRCVPCATWKPDAIRDSLFFTQDADEMVEHFDAEHKDGGA